MPVFIHCSTSFLILFNTIVPGENSTLFTEDTLRDSHGSVIYSSVIFRHGERAPAVQYPTDPYKEKIYWQTYWPQGKSRLSQKGQLQAYELGKWFRRRYDSFIGKESGNNFMKIYSSDADRALMSTKYFLAGFFLLSLNEMWTGNGLKMQSVPLRIIPSQRDTVINYKMKCERYDKEKEIINRSPEMKEHYFKYRKIFNYITTYSKLNATSSNIFEAFINAFYLYDSLLIEESHNLTLPAWTDSIYPEPLQAMAGYSLSNIAYSHQMRRIKAGFLIRKLIEKMELKIQGKLNEIIHFYSGHETTIAGLLTALEIYNEMVPPPTSSVILELRRKHEDYVVTILYRNSTTSAPYLLQLPGSKYVCTLERFKEWTKELIPQSWRKECTI